MNLTCIIVEDEPLARNLLAQYIDKIPYLTLLHSISNPVEALDILRNSAPDILFLDVQMPEITGITLLKMLKNKPLVILTTAYSEYAIEGYELDVTDYLLKPITFERFLKAVEKAHEKLAESTNQYTSPLIQEDPSTSANHFFFVKDGTKMVKVNFQDIKYIEGLKDYVKIYMSDKKITTLQRMKSLEELLPREHFIRIHHSYIVGLKWIEVIERDGLQIGDAIIPISDTYRKSFKKYIDDNQLGK